MIRPTEYDSLNPLFEVSTSHALVDHYRLLSKEEQIRVDKGIHSALELLIKSSSEEREEIIEEFLNQ